MIRLLPVCAALAGCGGSGSDVPATRFDFAVDSNSFNGNGVRIFSDGVLTPGVAGRARATFASGNRLLNVDLPASGAPGTYAFGGTSDRASATYGEVGIASTSGWDAATEGSIVVTRLANNADPGVRIVLKDVRFLANPGTPARGSFLLSGPGKALPGATTLRRWNGRFPTAPGAGRERSAPAPPLD